MCGERWRGEEDGTALICDMTAALPVVRDGGSLAERIAEGCLRNGDYPGFSHCLRCKRVWALCHGHTTFYTESDGCFPLCDACWADLSPHERLSYYYELWEQWIDHQDDIFLAIQNGSLSEAQGEAERKRIVHAWPSIQRAVLAGK